MTTQDFGNRVKARRKELGLSQLQLALRIGYKDKSTVAKIESGDRDLPRSKIVEIAEALSVTPQYLLGWEEEPDKKTASSEAARKQEFIELFDLLSPEEKKLIVAQMRGILANR